MANKETFAHYTNFNNTDGSPAIYVGQATAAGVNPPLALDAAEVAQVNLDRDSHCEADRLVMSC